jgi:hypothetical protein
METLGIMATTGSTSCTIIEECQIILHLGNSPDQLWLINHWLGGMTLDPFEFTLLHEWKDLVILFFFIDE